MTPWPGHEQIAKLLNSLRELMRDFSVTSEKLDRDRRTITQRAETGLAEAHEDFEIQAKADARELEALWGEKRVELQARFDGRLARIDALGERFRKESESTLDVDKDKLAANFQHTVWSTSTNLNSAHTSLSREYNRRQARLSELAGLRAKLEHMMRRRARFAKLTLSDLPTIEDAPGFDADYPSPEAAIEDLVRRLTELEESRVTLRQRHGLMATIKSLPGMTLLILALLALGVTGAMWMGIFEVPGWVRIASLLMPVVVLFGLPWAWYKLYQRRLAPDLLEVWERICQAHWLHLAADALVKASYSEQESAAERRREKAEEESRLEHDGKVEEAVVRHRERVEEINGRLDVARAHLDRARETALARARDRAVEQLAELHERQPEEQEALQREHAVKLQKEREDLDRAWETLVNDWQTKTKPLVDELAHLEIAARELFPPLDTIDWAAWRPPQQAAPAASFGRLPIDLPTFAGRSPNPELLPLPGSYTYDLPATFDVPADSSLLIESAGTAREPAIAVIQQIMLRLLVNSSPGRISFTIIDPIGLGQSFAAFMHLADYDESFVGRRIWTESRHIEQQLADINEHMEKVIQKYLRNEYESIAEYNESAGELAERYRFVVICDFPANFTESAAQRLSSIVSSGARCGVFVLLHKDRREPTPKGFDMVQLRRNAVCLSLEHDELKWRHHVLEPLPLVAEEPPDRELFTTILQRVGECVEEALRVEVSYKTVAPLPEETWSRSSADGLDIPIGKSGANKRQEMAIGYGTSQHAIIAGKTGSGKSTLFHVIITSLSLWYSPDEVEFYLVDFKKGVEFKIYARGLLPHVRAVAIESDRDFGLSILHRLDEELKKRGERFRELEVQNLSAYRQQAPDHPMPRVLLIVDEFQELFTEDDRISQESALLLDRIVRQGRAFGIHVILGSQTLGGAYSLARTTMGQMTVRIALQCSEADSYLILSDDNAAARLLNRPGEAIYNDAAGMVEGNSPFQVAWLSDQERDDYLHRVADHAREQKIDVSRPPIVFEGNAPAHLVENSKLMASLRGETPRTGETLRLWLGAPNTIKGPVHADLEPQTAQHLLVVGQSLAEARSLTAGILVSLAAHRDPLPRVLLIDGSPADAPQAESLKEVAEKIELPLEVVAYRDVDETLKSLSEMLTTREAERVHQPPAVLVIFGLQRFRQFRYEDDFGYSGDSDKPPAPDKLLDRLINEGAELGLHLVVWCDSTANLTRTLSRRAQNAFAYKVLFQMSVTDSTSLIDQPEAAKLGLHLALLADENRGRFEKFRPYALPNGEFWSALKNAPPPSQKG